MYDDFKWQDFALYFASGFSNRLVGSGSLSMQRDQYISVRSLYISTVIQNQSDRIGAIKQYWVPVLFSLCLEPFLVILFMYALYAHAKTSENCVSAVVIQK